MKKLFTACSLLLISVPSFAINLQNYKFSDAYRYSIVEDSGLERDDKPLTFNMSYAHLANPLYLTDSTSNVFKKDIIKNYNLITWGLTYHLDPKFSVGIDGSFVQAKVYGESKSNFGETRIKAKMNIMSSEDSQLSITPALMLPTGQQGTFTSQKSLGLSVMATYEKNLSPFHILFGAGYAHSDENTYSIINYRNLAMIELAGSYDLNSLWNVNLELNRNFTLATDKDQDAGGYYLTFKNKSIENVNTFFGAGLSGFDSLGSRSWKAFLGVKLAL